MAASKSHSSAHIPLALKDVSLKTAARCGTKCHILGSQPLKSGERERQDLCSDPSRTACHTPEIPSPLWISLLFDTYKDDPRGKV